MNKNKLHIVMQKVIENKEQNFEMFYRECKDYVFKIVFSIIKNKDDSEDIMQNLFVKIYKLPKDKLPSRNETSWLYTVAKNETLNYIKSKRKDINIDDLQIYKDDEGISNLINEASYKELMKKLNSEEELIVKLKTESNFTFKEIAEILVAAIHTLKLFITNLCLFVICTSIVKLMDKNMHEEQQSNDDGINGQNGNEIITDSDEINGQDGENTIDAEKNGSQENQELDSAIENDANTENSSQKNEMDWPDSFIENELDTIITDSIISENNNAINENNINESSNSDDLEETTQTIENATFNTTTKLPFYFLTILFLVLSIIFLIKFIKYQLKRKTKLSSK